MTGPAARRPGLVAGLTTAGLAAVGYVAAVSPAPGANHYPGCPLLALTGWYCPGCGGLRAVHALTHGDVGAAFGFNPLLMAALPVAAGLYLDWAWRAATGRPRRAAPAWAGWAGLAVVIAFWVARNLPAGAVLAP